MKRFLKIGMISAIALSSAACTRVETGEIGVRIGMDKQIQATELQPGSLNQTIFGDVLTFPVKDNQVDIDDLHPMAKDDSTVKDFDVSTIYSINPTSVSEIYIKKNRAFHAYDENSGDTYLMYNYVAQLTRTAAYKVARQYDSLKMNDSRTEIEVKIKEELERTLRKEGLSTSVTISQVMIRSIVPADNIVSAANALVQAQKDQQRKEIEVQTAKLEAERIAALNANKGAIDYMNAVSLQNISEGVKNGKTTAIIVPYDFKGVVNVPK